jgi:hypothetical protein
MGILALCLCGCNSFAPTSEKLLGVSQNLLTEELDLHSFAPLQLIQQARKQVLFGRSSFQPTPPKIDLILPSRQWMADRKRKLHVKGAFMAKASEFLFQARLHFMCFVTHTPYHALMSSHFI